MMPLGPLSPTMDAKDNGLIFLDLTHNLLTYPFVLHVEDRVNHLPFLFLDPTTLLGT